VIWPHSLLATIRSYLPGDKPRSVQRALSMVGEGSYWLGAGGWSRDKTPDVPWTIAPNGQPACDCSRFALCWCHELPGHMPGFNDGQWATVADDLNSNSALEDAEHRQQLFTLVMGTPEPGDLIVYKTFRLTGHPKQYVGHAAIIVGVRRGYQPGRYELLDIVQVRGPNGKRPGCVKTDASVFAHHDAVWGDVASRRSAILRVRPR
jgi:hypothetical protein